MHLLHIFFVSHNKWTRPILYVVIYFFCNVFPTIHTLVYVITFVLCHHLYLDVCVSTSTEFIKIASILLYTNVFFVAFFIQQKIYPKQVLPFVGIVLAETQQRRDIGMLIT